RAPRLAATLRPLDRCLRRERRAIVRARREEVSSYVHERETSGAYLLCVGATDRELKQIAAGGTGRALREPADRTARTCDQEHFVFRIAADQNDGDRRRARQRVQVRCEAPCGMRARGK